MIVRYENGEPVAAFLDLKTCAEWKGMLYQTVANNRLLQPLLGYSRQEVGFGIKKKRFFPKAAVREWLPVFSEELPAYIAKLLASDDPALVAHVKETLRKAEATGRIPVRILDENTRIAFDMILESARIGV